MIWKSVLLIGSCFLLSVFCLVADYVVFKSPLTQYRALKPLTDTLAHGIIAGWSCAHMLLWQPDTDLLSVGVVRVTFGVAIGSLVDVDHFIEAKSWKLEDALNLSHRPFAHNSFLIVPLILLIHCIIFLFSNYQLINNLNWVPSTVLVSIFSHHLRDADRRGVWLGALSTPPIPYKLYVVLIIALPFVVKKFYLLLSS